MYQITITIKQIVNMYNDDIYIYDLEAFCFKEGEIIFSYTEENIGINCFIEDKKLDLILKCGDVYIFKYEEAKPKKITLGKYSFERNLYGYPKFNKEVPIEYLKYISDNRKVGVLNICLFRGEVIFSLHDDIKIGEKIMEINGMNVEDGYIEISGAEKMLIDRAIYPDEITLNGRKIKTQEPFEEYSFRFYKFILKCIVNPYYIHYKKYGLVYKILYIDSDELRFVHRNIILADGKPIWNVKELYDADELIIEKIISRNIMIKEK